MVEKLLDLPSVVDTSAAKKWKSIEDKIYDENQNLRYKHEG